VGTIYTGIRPIDSRVALSAQILLSIVCFIQTHTHTHSWPLDGRSKFSRCRAHRVDYRDARFQGSEL